MRRELNCTVTNLKFAFNDKFSLISQNYQEEKYLAFFLGFDAIG